MPRVKDARPKQSPALKQAVGAAVARALRRDSETKYALTNISKYDFTVGGVALVSGLVGGSTVFTRVGNLARARLLQVRGKFYDLYNSNTQYKLSLVSCPGGTVPTVGTAWTYDATLSVANPSYRARFRVLKEQLFATEPSFINQDTVAQISWDVNLGDLPLEYSGPNAADGTRNMLYLIFTADYASSASAIARPVANEAAMYIDTVLSYTDE